MTASPGSAIGYVRVSTADQVEGSSLSHQEGVIRDWCERRGITLVDIVQSAGESGKDLDRPGFRAVQARIAAGGISHVVVAKVDRLSRNLVDVASLLEDWDDLGVSLTAVDDGINGTAGTNRLIAHILAWIAEDERKRIRNRIVPGKRARAEAGLPASRTPFGYRIKDRRMVIDPEDGPIVRAIFAVAAQEEVGPQTLAKRLQQRYPDRRWDLGRGRIQGILSNPIYTGTLTTQVDGGVVIRHENHEALVDETTYLSIQDQRRQRARALRAGGNDTQARSLLGGIMHCGACGAGMTITEAGGQPAYACLSRYRSGRRCAMPLVNCGDADQAVLVRLIVHLDDLGQHLHETWVAGAARAGDDWTAAQVRARQTLEQHDQLVGEAIEQLATGLIDADAFAVRTQEINDRREQARQSIDSIDVWSWLAKLFGQDEDGQWKSAVEQDGSLRLFMPLSVLVGHIGRRSLRVVLRAAAQRLNLFPDGQLDVTWSRDVSDYEAITKRQGAVLRHGLLLDQRAVLRRQGYKRTERLPDGHERWERSGAPNPIWLPPAHVVRGVDVGAP